jgi:hypothetical protein
MFKTFVKETFLPGLGSFLGFWMLAIVLRFAVFLISPVIFLVLAYIPATLILSIVLWFKDRKALALGLIAALLLNCVMQIVWQLPLIYLLIPFFFISE